jgi:aspartate-semialdehyde dehydrogenase
MSLALSPHLSHPRYHPPMKVAILTDQSTIAGNVVSALPANTTSVVIAPGEEPHFDADVAIFFSDALSQKWRGAYREHGAFVIDHSTASRMDVEIPTIVPHVNGDMLSGHGGIVSSPNCASVLLVTVLGPLHESFGIRRAVVTTLQAISGAGDDAARLFEAEVSGGDVGAAFPKPMALNHHARFPQSRPPRDDDQTDEEAETAEEVQRILGDPGIRVSATCVRVPVRNAHGIAVHLELDAPATRADAEAVLAGAPFVVVRERDDFPTPLEVNDHDDVHVGRLRVDPTTENGLALFLVGDNLRRGTALNAVEIIRALAAG